jgi:hypothetical protein
MFLDIQPTKKELNISIRKDRKNPSKTYKVTYNLDLNEIKKEIENAYKNIP